MSENSVQIDPRHSHEHPACEPHEHQQRRPYILTIRSHSGLSGDMLLAGLAVLALQQLGLEPESGEGRLWLANLAAAIMPCLKDSVRLERTPRCGVLGWHASVSLPHNHEHRNLADIEKIIAASGLSERGKELAANAFKILAVCEASAHGLPIDEVHFHEVGALDSILDMCATTELYVRLGEPELVSSPLPMADGEISCAHGKLPTPAPAVLALLRDVPVIPFAGSSRAGELVTPTAIALLKALKATFGPWPQFRLAASALVYGSREFADAPNGALFAFGASSGGAELD